MTVIDDENNACLLIANVTPDHAGLWTCEIGNYAQTSSVLSIGEVMHHQRHFITHFYALNAIEHTYDTHAQFPPRV